MSQNKSILGVAYLGEGDYTSTKDGKKTIQYSYWYGMLKRCYYKRDLERFPTYEVCEVCEDWLCFQTFAKWFDENYYEIEGQAMCLDKDILHKGNKLYSPDNCVFVSNEINCLFTKSNSKRGKYPIGIYYDTSYRKYKAQCSYIDRTTSKKKRKNLGRYDTPEQAFYQGYKPFKEAYIKSIANIYHDYIPKELYEAMYRYVVEIND